MRVIRACVVVVWRVPDEVARRGQMRLYEESRPTLSKTPSQSHNLSLKGAGFEEINEKEEITVHSLREKCSSPIYPRRAQVWRFVCCVCFMNDPSL